jgi:hypothetical protein
MENSYSITQRLDRRSPHGLYQPGIPLVPKQVTDRDMWSIVVIPLLLLSVFEVCGVQRAEGFDACPPRYLIAPNLPTEILLWRQRNGCFSGNCIGDSKPFAAESSIGWWNIYLSIDYLTILLFACPQLTNGLGAPRYDFSLSLCVINFGFRKMQGTTRLLLLLMWALT